MVFRSDFDAGVTRTELEQKLVRLQAELKAVSVPPADPSAGLREELAALEAEVKSLSAEVQQTHAERDRLEEKVGPLREERQTSSGKRPR